MNNQWNTPIDKLMLWNSNSWSKYDSKLSGKATLRVHYDQLMIISDTKIIESFNMNSKIKGVYKGDALILIVSVTGQPIRKLRFQLKSDVEHCLSKLGEHFPVTSHSSLQTKTSASLKYRQINDIFKLALDLDDKESMTSVPLPTDYGNFIKVCLLDPAFPHIVTETAKLLKEDLLKEH